VPAGTSQTNAVSERRSQDLRAELTRALAEVDAGTLQAILEAPQTRPGGR
jgi:hypothetical protein